MRLNTRQELIETIKKMNLFKREKFETETEWHNAIVDYAYSFNLIPPTTESELATARGNIRNYWTLEAKDIKDITLLTKLLNNTFELVEDEVRTAFKRRFETKIKILETDQLHKIEDIDLEITNAKLDYDIKTRETLAFLKEQAEIARAVNIAKSTLDAELTQGGTPIITTNENNKPFYLRGYEAIEKEIDVIENRKHKELFIEKLLELEQQKRALLQDSEIKRVKIAFNSSPILNSDEFSAAQINLAELKVVRTPSIYLIIFLSIILGFISSVVIIYLRSVIKQSKII